MILICEISFWVFVLLGFCFRYLFKMRRIGATILIFTPIIDFILFIFTITDLKSGTPANFTHGIAAIYIGVSVSFGHTIIKRCDERFAYYFANGSKPVPQPKYGKAYANIERSGWYKHLLAWMIGVGLIIVMILIIKGTSNINSLFNVIKVWTIVLIIDFIISFSYTFWPRTPENK